MQELAKMVSADILAVRGKIAVFGAKNRGKAVVTLGVQKKQQVKKPTVRSKKRDAYLYR